MQARAGANDRAELLRQRADAGSPGSASHRERLLNGAQKLDKSGERIQQSRQMVAEMEVRLVLQNNLKLSVQSSCRQKGDTNCALQMSWAAVMEVAVSFQSTI